MFTCTGKPCHSTHHAIKTPEVAGTLLVVVVVAAVVAAAVVGRVGSASLDAVTSYATSYRDA